MGDTIAWAGQNSEYMSIRFSYLHIRQVRSLKSVLLRYGAERGRKSNIYRRVELGEKTPPNFFRLIRVVWILHLRLDDFSIKRH